VKGDVPEVVKRVLSPTGLAWRFGVGRKTILRHIREGKLVAYRLNGRLRILPEDANRWAASCREVTE